MKDPRKNKARGRAGSNVAAGREAKATRQNKIFRCGVQHTSKLRRELHGQGLALRDVTGDSQRVTLLRVLQYLGARGINTIEGVGCGFYRIATRVQELEEGGWLIESRRERVLGADGLTHDGIARYVLKGRRFPDIDAQGALDLEAQP
jgi:hypothetical protein